MNLFVSSLLTFVVATNLLRATAFQRSSPDTCPTNCICSVDLTEINCNGRGFSAIPDHIPSVAKVLDLSVNQISAIPSKAFVNLTALNKLYLERNLIAAIHNDSFQGLKNLKDLLLRQNRLTNLGLPREAFRGLNSLQHLYLENNQLSSIPDVSLATGLTILNLDSNVLTSVTFPEGFENLRNLNSVYIPNNNRFQRIARKDFQYLNRSAVRTINLAGCKLLSVEHGVFNFTHLQGLTLSNNSALNGTSLRNIFKDIGEMVKPEMNSLRLSGTIMTYEMTPDLFEYLKTVPLREVQLDNSKLDNIINGTFDFFPKLLSLDLSKSQINKIFDGTFSEKLISLKKLLLQKNSLRSIPRMNLPNLTELDLSEHKDITVVPEFVFSGVSALKILILRQCGISTLQRRSFAGLSNLITLDLSGNAIEKSNIYRTAFQELRSLVSLDLSLNSMRAITSNKYFAPLGALQKLDLSGNYCGNISLGIFRSLKNLTSLNLQSNQLGDVISSDQDGVLFRGLEKLTKLFLQDNAIKTLPPGLFVDQINIENLDLSKNWLTTTWPVRFLSPKLVDEGNRTVVNLASNRIPTVGISALKALPVRVRLDLSSNPFACGCDLIPFRRWISESNATAARLLGLSSYRCNSPEPSRPLLAFNPDSIQQACIWRSIVIGVACGVAASAAFLVGLAYRHRWPLRLKAYRIRRWMSRAFSTITGHQRSGNGDGGFEYDVMVSYVPSERDRRWVASVLIPAIDDRESNRLAAELASTDGSLEPDGPDVCMNEDVNLIDRGQDTVEDAMAGRGGEIQKFTGSGGIDRDEKMRKGSAAERRAEKVEIQEANGVADADLILDRNMDRNMDGNTDRNMNSNMDNNINPQSLMIPADRAAAQTSNAMADNETYNVFFEARDAMYNKSEIGAIAEAISTSRRILLVVSAAYLRDARRCYEIELAVRCCCDRGWTNLEGIIVVQLDPGVDVRLPTTLHLLAEKHRILEWTEDKRGRELFWSGLREELRRPLPERRESSAARSVGDPEREARPEIA